MSASGRGERPSRRGPRVWAQDTFSSLALPNYRRFFTGHVLSLHGFWMRIIAQGWIVHTLAEPEHVGRALGAVTAASLLPFAVLSPLGGVLADNVDRRRLLMSVPLVSATVNATLGIMIVSEVVRLPHVFVAAILIGLARAVEIPARNAFVRDLVGRAQLGNAIALNAAGFNVARVLGPAVGGAVLALAGTGPCFLVAAVLNVTMWFALRGVRDTVRATEPTGGSPLQQLAEGFRYVRGHRRTRTLLLLLAISLVCIWSYQSLMAAYAADVLGLGEAGFGFLMAAPGFGALLGALWVAGRIRTLGNPRVVVFGLVGAGAACTATLANLGHVEVAIPFLIGAGFCQVAFMATANSMVQESVPDALRGRVMGIWTFVFGTFFPVGGLIMGWVADRRGFPWAWGGGAILAVVASAVVWLRMPRRKHDREEEPMPEDEAAEAIEAGTV